MTVVSSKCCCLQIFGDGDNQSHISAPLLLVCSHGPISLDRLEESTANYLVRNSASDEIEQEEIELFHPNNEDSILLKCGSNDPKKSVWGTLEPSMCTVAIFQPQLLQDESDIVHKFSDCSCCHPRGIWARKHLAQVSENGHGRQIMAHTSDIQIIDLASLQMKRRVGGSFIKSAGCEKIPLTCVRMDQPSSVLHVLRSSLQMKPSSTNFLHAVTPWKRAYENLSTNYNETNDQLSTIGLIFLYSPISENNNNSNDDELQYWKTLEMDELKHFIQFRTGDAIPSYHLYSVSRLSADERQHKNSSFWKHFFDTLPPIASDDNVDTNMELNRSQYLELALLIYKPLPPRLHMLKANPDNLIVDIPSNDYCLWEKYTIDEHDGGDKSQKYSDGTNGTNQDTVLLSDHVSYRRVAPPYQDVTDIYPAVFDQLLAKDNFKMIVQEALSIPNWIAWPERNHYQDSTHSLDGSAIETNNAATYASWTVFPLCHTFPATDLHSRKWIQRTCQYVPNTVSLLRNHPILSPLIRTVLFSRLQPQTTLGAHTGWADLANFVLRVHIPLIVPPNDISALEEPTGDGPFVSGETKKLHDGSGLCGLWVDGCVETHDEGRILCFDDSKVHRAFNYSNQDRIILIIDLVRPKSEIGCFDDLPDFPHGHSVGGHTEELDSFIRQYE